MGEQWEQEDWEAEEELARLENQLASLPGLEITAVVSRAPFEEWEEGGNRTWEDVGERNIGNDPVLVDSTSLLLLSWWQVKHLFYLNSYSYSTAACSLHIRCIATAHPC